MRVGLDQDLLKKAITKLFDVCMGNIFYPFYITREDGH